MVISIQLRFHFPPPSYIFIYNIYSHVCVIILGPVPTCIHVRYTYILNQKNIFQKNKPFTVFLSDARDMLCIRTTLFGMSGCMCVCGPHNSVCLPETDSIAANRSSESDKKLTVAHQCRIRIHQPKRGKKNMHRRRKIQGQYEETHPYRN